MDSSLTETNMTFSKPQTNRSHMDTSLEGFFYEDLHNLRMPWIHEAHFLPTVIVYGVTFLIGIIGNSLVIFAMVGDKLSRSVTSSFLVSLALADIVFLVVCVPYETAKYFIGHWAIGTVLCKLVGFIEMMTAVTSILNLTAVSIERYVVIVHPMKSRRICTAKITKIILSCVWIISMMASAPMIHVMHTETATYYNNDSTVVMIYCGDVGIPEVKRLWVAVYRFLLMVVLPALVIIFCYVRVIHVLWISTKDLHRMTSQQRNRYDDSSKESCKSQHRKPFLSPKCSDSSPINKSARAFHNNERTKHFKSRLKDQSRTIQDARKQVIKMLIAVIVVFVLSWGPKLAFQIMQRLHLEIMHYQLAFTCKIILDCLPYIQSCINPLIYGFMSKNFRQSMRLACRRHCYVYGKNYGPVRRIFGMDIDTDSRAQNGTTHSFISHRTAARMTSLRRQETVLY
ncbi:galanin receptor type 1-like [Liolophura sinensis]|uniref:galanin receptor type 1-like n=1 Tax=Liolophura sinensis TaxID=3198878 RepID=UPI003159877E